MLLRVSAVVLAVGLLSGCALFDSGPKPVASTYVTLSDSSAGYALLYETVSKQKRANLLSYIKKETPELKALLERIAETSRTTADELEALAKAAPPLNLTATRLPKMELAARESIEKDTRKDILESKGVDLEFTMVSSQLSGLNYAAHLARSLAAVETSEPRKAFLQRTDRKYSQLHDQVYKMMYTRYRS